jgi:S-adenosylmethionine:tRNA ribosyltransferase-isomerase
MIMPMPNAELDYLLNAYDYLLPEELIAQDPMLARDRSRLFVVEADQSYHHQHFYQLPQFLRPGDLLVMNDTKVIPARLYGHKPSGTAVQILLLEPVTRSLTGNQADDRWLALAKPGKRLPVGSIILFGNGELKAEVVAIAPSVRGRELRFELPPGKTLFDAIADLGVMPLPPYINKSKSEPAQYQTVYAEQAGAIAAPTAGLHFTLELLETLKQQGIDQAFITLHVGIGTFRPVEVEDIRDHNIHHEWLELNAETAAKIKSTKANGGRIIGVGTTVARSLESCGFEPFRGKTNLMIYPGYEWKVLDGLITNFHIPKSSLMMLVASFLGDRQFLLHLYQEAIAQRYRFYSFGDAMLLWH